MSQMCKIGMSYPCLFNFVVLAVWIIVSAGLDCDVLIWA